VNPFWLGPGAAARGYRLDGRESVGSTMVEAARAAAAGDRGDLWVAALNQSAGRGRRGRVWQTTSGNLAASLLVEPGCEPALMATLGFVAGLALHEALSAVVEPALADRFRLKWPNDVLADGQKMAGILLEAVPLGTGQSGVVVGIGVNVVAAPEGVPYPVTSLQALGSAVTAPDVFAALSERWCSAFALWDQGRGLPDLLAAWRARAFGLNGPVRIEQNDEVIDGTFETVDETGRLVLRTPENRRIVISAGDVHFGAVRTLRS
jgi:BirA family biotin operon repressor/biotin-[acetyl-CoA-carboxylase] ligase